MRLEWIFDNAVTLVRDSQLRKLWESVDKTEQARRFLDLVVVSGVLAV